MKYAQQAQTALNRLNIMEEGELKDRYEELQNIIEISQVGNIGARGTTQTGTL